MPKHKQNGNVYITDMEIVQYFYLQHMTLTHLKVIILYDCIHKIGHWIYIPYACNPFYKYLSTN